MATDRLAHDRALRDSGSEPFVAEPTATGMLLNLPPNLSERYAHRFKHLSICEAPAGRAAADA